MRLAHTRRERTASIRFDRLIDEQRDLVADNLGLIGWGCQKYGRSFPALNDEEVRDAATDGLVRAAKKWDSERGVKFSTYAARAILNHLIRSSQKAMKQNVIRVTISIGEDGVSDVADTRTGERDAAMELATRLVRRRLGRGESMKDIAKAFRLSVESVRRIARDA